MWKGMVGPVGHRLGPCCPVAAEHLDLDNYTETCYNTFRHTDHVPMSSWETARHHVVSCLPVVEARRANQYFGKFFPDTAYARFGYRFASRNAAPGLGPTFVSAAFELDSEPSGETYVGLSVVTAGRALFLCERTIYDEPIVFNPLFPAFYFWWDKIGTSDTAALTFVRVDLSREAFINYEGPMLAESMRQGDDERLSAMPHTLSGMHEILTQRFIRIIRFEEHATALLAISELELFSKVCGALQS
ncbi:MAG: hypothetical protein A3C16_01220 [Candidatus Sungbacteria bacterium RIFCSPHIGHO2_02_FULL_51_29]|uniref:Uncharacterized protein n=1 Tax=Candidatus Sungbacteria bacterium RIFCSPHIGHO2_02_FULL_51_29 TaxID=1802273 RepID=A0A1G2KVQ6_9BACT|nr:MAG: hypothetical protein A3C16_01220 [Candidatus Sungbacteria bacterium RIFCSPHIGHO2_02_FULL_51_29]